MKRSKIGLMFLFISSLFACSKSQETPIIPPIPPISTNIPISGTIPNFTAKSMVFSSDNILYALGNDSAGSNVLYKSSDGGKTWINNTSFNQTMNAVYFMNDTKGIVAGNYFGTSANAATSWQSIAGLSETVVTLTPSKSQEVFLTKLLFDNTHGRKYTEIYTFDWASMGLLSSYITLDGYLKASHFLENKVVVFAGESGKVVKATLNNSMTWDWTFIHTNQSANLQSVAVLSEQDFIVAGVAGTLLKTNNAGASWTATATTVTGDFQKIRFIDYTTGYAIITSNNKGEVYKTTDGGTKWTKLNPIGNDSILDFSINSKGKLSMIGSLGNVYLFN